jgi:hypothetical protein
MGVSTPRKRYQYRAKRYRSIREAFPVCMQTLPCEENNADHAKFRFKTLDRK